MIRIESKDQRSVRTRTLEARKRRQLRPTVLTLEDRRLLSTFTVTSTLDNGSAGSLALGGWPGEFGRRRRDDRL